MEEASNNAQEIAAGNTTGAYAMLLRIARIEVDPAQPGVVIREHPAEDLTLLMREGSEGPEDEIKQLTGLFIDIARTWGMEVAVVMQNGTEVYNLQTGVGCKSSEEAKGLN